MHKQARVIVLGSFSKINPSVLCLAHKALGFYSSTDSEQILSEIEEFVF